MNKSKLHLLGAAMLLALGSTSVVASPAPTLEQVVESRSDKAKARDEYRHPVETLEFFQVKPGMVVAEALPGGGWYTEILADYLGEDGTLYGVNYADDMWARFGFFSPERIKERVASTSKFPELVAGFSKDGPEAEGFTFASVPASAEGTADRVLFIRALHNLNRFEKEAGTMTQAIEAASKLLKKGGMVGVVQHRAPESASDESVQGNRGYMKQSDIIKLFTNAGFKLVAKSEINANAKDKPSETDIVWRLPPSFNGSRDNPEQKQAMQAIGESDRMTLLFRKP
ncbi:methyltransferase [Shewanella corallii]|uniref:Methyltransferase n=2 Tax=Shewanella TaxID=22 RepID=A0ABT0NBT4_9GAMM|nr:MULTISPECIES: methyltransferase [Shewanella]MCL1039307.1 methyltransferase [Shewanella submarina]MCL2915942.1 methyltransferase [Shewanella corallii]